jgi:hypothetical protein
MPYTQAIFDNFSDNTIDTTKWTIVISSGLSEVSQKLRFEANTSYPTIRSQHIFNATQGIIAAKMVATGSGGTETEFEYGIVDSSGNGVALFGTPIDTTINIGVKGAATATSKVYTDTAGIGGGWTANSWIGVGNIGSDNIVRFYKSTDAITWTEMARATLGGTFNKTAVGFFISIGRWGGGSDAWTYDFDDASYFKSTIGTQFLIDDFNDNTIDLAKWAVINSTGITESGQKLNLTDHPSYPGIRSLAYQNLTEGILAAKMDQTGTPTFDTKLYFGIHDSDSDGVEIDATPADAQFEFFEAGSLTIVSSTIFDTTVGLGPSWIDGTWFGIGNAEVVGTDTVVHVYKSSNLSTWFEVARFTIFGTSSFNRTSARLVLGSGTSAGSPSGWVVSYDDVSFFANNPLVKVRVGGAWVTAKTKVRVGGAWVTAKPKVRVGGAWVIP